MEELIEARLIAALAPTLLIVDNQSHMHQQHASSPQTGHSHFNIKITAATLSGLTRIQQHQRIYRALGNAFDQGLHAISIEIICGEI